jgi:prepilin-type N-terminal cleavage/methylation domain-containing protein
VSARPAFTLLELLVAIVVAGIVALLVYGAAGAAMTTHERLAARRAASQTARAMRAVLTDALRNARPSTRFGETAFAIEDGTTPQGRPADRLSFVTSGGTPPLTGDVDWRVVLESTADGLTLTGVPLGMSDPPRIVVRAPGLGGVDVRALRPGAAGKWTDGGAAFAQVPRAVEITYWSDSGAVGLPARVVLPWSAAP